MTGLRAKNFTHDALLRVGKRKLGYAPTFEAARGAFWYENSLGLAEISMPRGNAAKALGLRIGYPIRIAR